MRGKFLLLGNNLLSFLGLAKKAGKLHLGMSVAVLFAKYGISKIVLVCFDLSDNSFKKLEKELLKYNLKAIEIKISIKKIEEFFGKKSGIITITDESFAAKISNMI